MSLETLRRREVRTSGGLFSEKFVTSFGRRATASETRRSHHRNIDDIDEALSISSIQIFRRPGLMPAGSLRYVFFGVDDKMMIQSELSCDVLHESSRTDYANKVTTSGISMFHGMREAARTLSHVSVSVGWISEPVRTGL